jgi:glycolate dehydrogenase iron-sulfur subunit
MIAPLASAQAEVDACIRCGLCLDSCPTYVLGADELDSPRGRIALTGDAIASGGVTEALATHIDSCLGCLACVSSCPSGVRFDHLLDVVRPAVEAERSMTNSERALRLLLFETLPYPKRLARLAPLIDASKRAPGRVLPESVSVLTKVAPKAPGRRTRHKPLPATTAGHTPTRGRVGLLLGCVQRVFFSDVHRATIAVLAAEGFEVVAPELPDCCGALELHGGEAEHGLARAQATIAAFAGCGALDYIVANSAGCGSAMKHYGTLLGHQPAVEFSAKVRDITELLGSIDARATRGPLPIRVVYHDACHLSHGQGVRSAPRELLDGIPGLTLLEVATERDVCCGSAGVYNLLQPARADELGRRKAQHLLDTGAEAIAAANPGCAAQLVRHTRELGRELPVYHPIELLGRSLRAAI